VQLASIIDGGGHERGMRSGTLNVPGIVGFGKAARALSAGDAGRESKRMLALRERLEGRTFSRSSMRLYYQRLDDPSLAETMLEHQFCVSSRDGSL